MMMAKKSASVKTVTLSDIEKKRGKAMAARSVETALGRKKADARLEKLEKSADKRADKSIKKNMKKIEKLTT
jgi:hypothetical protein